MGAEGCKACDHEKMVRVRYIDHSIFLNIPQNDVRPTLRESIGWLVEEGPDYLVMVSDRRLDPPVKASEKDRSSGTVLLKALILKLEEVGP